MRVHISCTTKEGTHTRQREQVASQSVSGLGHTLEHGARGSRPNLRTFPQIRERPYAPKAQQPRAGAPCRTYSRGSPLGGATLPSPHPGTMLLVTNGRNPNTQQHPTKPVGILVTNGYKAHHPYPNQMKQCKTQTARHPNHLCCLTHTPALLLNALTPREARFQKEGVWLSYDSGQYMKCICNTGHECVRFGTTVSLSKQLGRASRNCVKRNTIVFSLTQLFHARHNCVELNTIVSSSPQLCQHI